MTEVSLVAVAVVTGLALLVTGLRCVFVRDSATDRLINRALGFAGVGMICLMVTERVDLPAAVTHLGSVVGFLTTASVYGAARMMTGAPRARQRQRRYDSIALGASAVIALIDVAVLLDLVSGDISERCYSFATAMSCLPVAAAGVLLIPPGIREIRSGDTRFAARFAYIALISVAIFWVCYAVFLLARYRTGSPPMDPGKTWAITGFAFFALITVLLAIPLVRMLVVRVEWDRDSRDCRKLHPLWADLTMAIPQVTLAPDVVDQPGAAQRRYRMAVEIRDALMQLRRHGQDYSPDDLRGHTLRIVRSMEGRLPAETATDHQAELRYLLGMAAKWPRAKRAYLAADAEGATITAARATR